MPKTARSARQDTVNPPEVKKLLWGYRDLLVNLVVCLPVFNGMRVGEILRMTRIWIVWDKVNDALNSP